MKIIFSNHAINQMEERNISRIRALEAVGNPDKIIGQLNKRIRAIKLLKIHEKDYLLIVIFEKTELEIKIITTFITSKISKYL